MPSLGKDGEGDGERDGGDSISTSLEANEGIVKKSIEGVMVDAVAIRRGGACQ